MGISTVSFNHAKIYHSRMFFTRYGKNGVYTQVFDKNGKNLLNRVSNNTVKRLNFGNMFVSVLEKWFKLLR